MANLERFRLLIGGKAVDALSGADVRVAEPLHRRAVGDGRLIGGPGTWMPRSRPHGPRSTENGEEMAGFDRSAILHRLGRSGRRRTRRRLARLEVNDSGKLYREMLGQLNGMGGWYHYFAGLADKIEGRAIPSPNPNYLVYTRREPVGVVAAITPWNSPLLLITWKLAPALAAGCTMVFKPSEHAPASTLGFAELVSEAGFPPACSTWSRG